MLLHDKLKPYRLILASQSPRRRQLLSDAGLEFTLAPRFECEESFPEDMPAAEVAEYLSSLKSESYPEPLGEKDILLTADTVVIACGRILGKPANREEAIAMIEMLSGRGHEVVTGVTLRLAERTKRFSVDKIISHVSKYMTLKIGDLIYTGTPVGVGPVQAGDNIKARIGDRTLLDFDVR